MVLPKRLLRLGWRVVALENPLFFSNHALLGAFVMFCLLRPSIFGSGKGVGVFEVTKQGGTERKWHQPLFGNSIFFPSSGYDSPVSLKSARGCVAPKPMEENGWHQTVKN